MDRILQRVDIRLITAPPLSGDIVSVSFVAKGDEARAWADSFS